MDRLGVIMASVTVYSREDCYFSHAAKRLLTRYGLDFEDVDVDDDAENMDKMIRRSGGRFTTPQIFIHGLHIGGAEDLQRMADQGQLDTLSQAGAFE
jgi:glutaredoxin 3